MVLTGGDKKKIEVKETYFNLIIFYQLIMNFYPPMFDLSDYRCDGAH